MLGKIDTRFAWADRFVCTVCYVEYYWTNRKTLDANESLRLNHFELISTKWLITYSELMITTPKQSHLLPLNCVASNKYIHLNYLNANTSTFCQYGIVHWQSNPFNLISLQLIPAIDLELFNAMLHRLWPVFQVNWLHLLILHVRNWNTIQTIWPVSFVHCQSQWIVNTKHIPCCSHITDMKVSLWKLIQSHSRNIFMENFQFYFRLQLNHFEITAFVL